MDTRPLLDGPPQLHVRLWLHPGRQRLARVGAGAVLLQPQLEERPVVAAGGVRVERSVNQECPGQAWISKRPASLALIPTAVPA